MTSRNGADNRSTSPFSPGPLLSSVTAEPRQPATLASAALGASVPETETSSLGPGALEQKDHDPSHTSHGVAGAAVRPRYSLDNIGRRPRASSSHSHSDRNNPHHHHHHHLHQHQHDIQSQSTPNLHTRGPSGHQRSASLTSPPPPPADFNPPPDFSSELPLHGISPPPPPPLNSSSGSVSTIHLGGSTSPVAPGVWWADEDDLAALSPSLPPNMVSSSSSSETVVTVARPQRPQIRAVQQVSSDSVNRSQHSSASTSSCTNGSSTSDSGEVLAQRRDELMSTILSAEGCDELQLARRSSASPIASPSFDNPAEEVEVDPTLPMAAVRLTEQSLDTVEGGGVPTESRGRPRSFSNQSAEETIHAWDSVWPASNAVRRVNVPFEPGPSRFPMAPMSPYVTPSFSPAIVHAQAVASRRLSTSPPASHDSLFADRPVPSSPGLRVLSQTTTTLASKHSASRSEESSHSPPTSPQPSTSTLWGSEQPQPSSPVGTGAPRTRPIAYAPGSPVPGSSRTGATGGGSSPPVPSISSPGPSRIRLDRPPSFIAQFSELTPPFISRRELPTSTSKLTRRLSETAIARDPDASLRLEGQAGQSSTISEPEPRRGHDDMSAADILLSPSMALRPTVLRRAKSAQDTHDGGRSPPPPLAIQPLDDGAPHASTSRDLPSHVGYGRLGAFEMEDDSAIADDDDSDEEPPKALEPALPTTPIPPAEPTRGEGTMPEPLQVPETTGPLTLVDEGDLLPSNTAIVEMDVTFDDEGLNTLERIFLLSRSEYAFHRAYVARVLGDLLGDVDPCESVEYVLPLISAFSLDEDETVKEAFAADLHRILWYFFTTCHLLPAEEEDQPSIAAEGREPEPAPTTEPQLNAVPETIARLESFHRTRPIDIDMGDHPALHGRSPSGESPSPDGEGHSPHEASSSRESQHTTFGLSGSAHFSAGNDTPITSMTSSAENGFGSAGKFLDPVGDNGEKLWSDDTAGAPALHVSFFRPLLGTMLLSHNPQVANPTRDGIVQLIARLRGHGTVNVETWGSTAEVDHQRQTFLSQTGPHCHDPLPFDDDARALVEQELLYGIVLGMGALSTEVPDSLFNDSVEILGDDGEVINQDYEVEMYRQQMVHEATLGRALSLSFIGAMCEFYPPDDVVKYGFVDEVIRGQDGDVSTRAEAALAIGNVARAAPPDEIRRLLEAFTNFANDEDPQVRQSACTGLPALSKRIQSEEERREFAVKAMKGFMENGNEEVQCAALEALGEVIYAFAKDPLGPPHELLEIYCNDKDSCDEDCDWDILASFNFPGVCLTLGPDRWPELRGLYNRLVTRAGSRVLRTIAASLHELAAILHPEQVAEDILPVYRRCMTYGDDIRELIFEHIDVLIARLPQALGWSSFKNLTEMWQSDTLGGWRARERLALHIPSFLETFHQHSEVAVVLDMMNSALLDRFAAVRDAATFAVPRSYEILRRSKCSQDVLHNMLLNLGFSSNYRQRLTFVRCLREFIRPPPNRQAFEEVFMPSLLQLSQDVVDVRLGLAKAIADLFVVGAFYGDKALAVPPDIKRLAAVLADDDSVDVREVITRIGADRWRDQPAITGLVQEMQSTDSPKEVKHAIASALSSEGSSDSNVVAPSESRHERAVLASPLVVYDAPQLDLDMNLEQSAGDDPFASSFGASVSAGESPKSGTSSERERR